MKKISAIGIAILESLESNPNVNEQIKAVLSDIESSTVGYKFYQLSDEAKVNALNSNRDYNVNDKSWAREILDSALEVLNNMGFIDSTIYYVCTGTRKDDVGASFLSKSIDVEKFLRHIGRWDNYHSLRDMINKSQLVFSTVNVDDVISRSVRIVHNNVDIESSDLEHLLNKINSWYHDFTWSVYEELREYYEFLISDEALTEFFSENDFFFDINGEMLED